MGLGGSSVVGQCAQQGIHSIQWITEACGAVTIDIIPQGGEGTIGIPTSVGGQDGVLEAGVTTTSLLNSPAAICRIKCDSGVSNNDVSTDPKSATVIVCRISANGRVDDGRTTSCTG